MKFVYDKENDPREGSLKVVTNYRYISSPKLRFTSVRFASLGDFLGTKP